MESITYLKNIRIAPKKLRFLQFELKKCNPMQALEILRYTPRHSARIWRKALQTAINNAKQSFKVSENMLELKALAVDQGFVMKRFRAGSRGTAKSIKKRYSHIKIILTSKETSTGKKIVAGKEEPKKEEKKVIKASERKEVVKKVQPKKRTVRNKAKEGAQ